MKLKKNEEYIVDIIDMGIEAEGIAKIDNFPIFIKQAIKGEKIKTKIIKVNKNYAIGIISEIIEKSEDRVEPFCKVYKRCGGCNLQHLKYDAQLEYKKNVVKNNFRKFGLDESKIKQIIGMENPFEYRNKAQYPFSIDKDGNPITGFYANRSHDIIKNDICKIEHAYSEKIVKEILELVKENNISIYNEKTNKGYLRHVVIKVGFSTDEVMVIFVTNGRENKLTNAINEILKNNKNIKTIVQNINTKNTNVILGDKNITLYGDGYIKDKLDTYTFNISPLSFYQINPIQTKKLYSKVKEYLGKDINVLFDLYCGIGTIGIYCSDSVKQLYAIEIIPDAIKDAKENAKINNVENANFYVGEAENTINELYQKGIYADAVIVDPPRKGLDKKLVDVLLDKMPNKIVYVSCNNATLSRDLQLLKEKYDLIECTLFDLFPHTSHVECIVLLKLR